MMSGRARRMMTHHLRNKADAELNLIPMIDILSVLVAFLLVYSTEVEVVQNTKGIEIPESIVVAKPRETVVVTLTKDEVFVQGERITSIAEVPPAMRRHCAAARRAQAAEAHRPEDGRARSGRARDHDHGRQITAVRSAEKGHGDLHRRGLRQDLACHGAAGQAARPEHLQAEVARS